MNEVIVQWFDVKDKLPEENSVVFTWNGTDMRVCRYSKELTWKGRKMKFVNVFSHGMWDDEVTHWMYLPTPPKKG